MQLDLIEIKPKRYKIRVVSIAIAIILVIGILSIAGIYCAKKYNYVILRKRKQKTEEYNLLNNQTINQEQQVIDNKIDILEIEDRRSVKKALLPVYSDNAKKQIKEIYSNKAKVAYLTFDDGPSQAVTPLILDLLKEENIKATFFVLGLNVDRNPDLVKRAYLEGNYIANHGYSHNYSKMYADSENILKEYYKTEKSIQKAIENEEYESHLFRFPGGYNGGKYAKIKKSAGEILNSNNISYIDWNCLSGDAEGANTKEKILNYIKKYSKDKGTIVILMHDASTKILTYETLKGVIDYLRQEGYTFESFYNIMQ